MKSNEPDPALLEVLQDLECVHNPRLFPSPRSIARGLSQLDNIHGLGQMRLSNIESHLLHSHKEELSRLLRQLCLKTLVEDSLSASDLFVPSEQEEQAAYIGTSAWNAAADTILEQAPSTLLALDECAMLRGYLQRSLRFETCDASALALASLRIAPSWQAMIYLSKDLCRKADMRPARNILSKILRVHRTGSAKYFAHTNLGAILAREEDYSGALDNYRLAAETDPQPLACMNWFAFSCITLNESEALRASRLIDDISPGIPNFPSRRQGDTTPHRNPTHILIRRIGERLGEPSRRIADALAG